MMTRTWILVVSAVLVGCGGGSGEPESADDAAGGPAGETMGSEGEEDATEAAADPGEPADEPAGDVAEAPAEEAPSGDEAEASKPSCEELSEKKCKITMGCAWSEDETCTDDRAGAMP